MYIVYKLTRSDGQLYIGTTYQDGFKKRMKAHSKSDRFLGFEFDVEILEESQDFDYISVREPYYIDLYDTYENGLNKSVDGKGNHLCDDFTTRGYRFSVESRLRMRESAKRRVERDGVPFKGCSHTKEQRERWSDIRRGVLPPNTKLTEEVVKEIINLFSNKPHLEGVGQTMKNGRKLSYIRAFSLKYGDVYGVTPEQIERIIRGKTWKYVERKYQI